MAVTHDVEHVNVENVPPLSEMTTRTYIFRVLVDSSDASDVSLVGNHVALGSWEPRNAPKLTLVNNGWYELRLEVPSSVVLSGVEYKFAQRSRGGAWNWESCSNRVLAPNFLNGPFVVCNVWNVLDTTTSFANLISFNLRYDNPGDGKFSWSHRKQHIAEYLKSQNADIICVQEALWHMAHELGAALGNSWSFYFAGRDDGDRHGEASAIFYKNTTFDLVSRGTFWLSEQPDQVGSRSWGAACLRVCSWARLRHRLTGKQIAVFNAHLDHISSEARSRSLSLIVRRIYSTCGDGIPAVLCGDFNMPPSETAMKNVIVPPKDPRTVEAVPGPLIWAPLQCCDPSPQISASSHPSTFTGFRKEESILIDYILVRPNVNVLMYSVGDNFDPENKRPPLSDHRPIAAHLTF